jgi:transcriptional regulator with XRE-family HTH domain
MHCLQKYNILSQDMQHYCKILLANVSQLQYIYQKGDLNMNSRERKYGEYLRNLRRGNHMTLRYVEKNTGISNSYLSQIEQGKRGIPSVAILEKLAKIYGLSLHQLINEYEMAARSVKSETKKQSDKLELMPDIEFLQNLILKLTEDNLSQLKSYILFLISQQDDKSK